MVIDPCQLEKTYRNIFEGLFRDYRAEGLENALLTIAADAEVQRMVPAVAERREKVLAAQRLGDPEEREAALLELYLCLHAVGWTYSAGEQIALDHWVGVECLPGGMMPLLLAAHLIGPDSVCADLGAGNGLQGLLLQMLQPHRRTVQVELAGELIAAGRRYQQALGIAAGRMDWRQQDLAEADLTGIDLIYLYRPARPMGRGRDLYQAVADNLAACPQPVTIVSLADCLGRFLSSRFAPVYQNEFVDIFRG